MIFVDRNRVPVPESLRSQAAEKARASVISLFKKSNSHRSQLRSTFVSSIWLKARFALTELFFDKCAYCESPTRGSLFHDVDHFRPKQSAGGLRNEDEHLYYGWLAYEWDNLYNACPVCNRRRNGKDGIVGKGNFFPVEGKRAPLLASISECRKIEKNTLIDPCHDEPSDHLYFEPDGRCHGITNRGNLTISLLDLNREALLWERKKICDLISELLTRISAVSSNSPDAASNEILLSRLLEPQAAHAGCARCCFDQLKSKFGLENLQAIYTSDSAKLVLNPEASREVHIIRNTAEAKSISYTSIFDPSVNYWNKKKLPSRATQRLSRVEIKNFKSLELIEIDIPPTTSEEDHASALMLLGENSSGKSTILEAIALTLLGTDQIKLLGIDGKKCLRRDSTWSLTNEPAEIKLYFDESDKNIVTLSIDPKDGSFNGSQQQQVVILGYGPRRYFNEKRTSKRSPEAYARVRTMFDPMAILGNPRGWLMNCSEHEFRASVRALRQVMLLNEESYVARPAKGQRKGKDLDLMLNETRTPLSHLSEGYRTVVATSVDIMQEMLTYWPNLEDARGIVLIDELDTHLHPRWKMRIMSRLREAMPQVQFIATTHDPLCLRGLYDGEVQVLRRRDDLTVEQVSNLPNVQGLSVEQLLTSDFFGLLSTEDPHTDEELIRYSTLASKSNPDPEAQAQLALYRDSLDQKIRLGSTPQTQLMYEVASEYLRRQRSTEKNERIEKREGAAIEVLDLWLSMKDGAPST